MSKDFSKMTSNSVYGKKIDKRDIFRVINNNAYGKTVKEKNEHQKI